MSLIEQVKERLPLVEGILRYSLLDLKKSDVNKSHIQTLCCFHSEKSPSLSINSESDSTQDLYFCHGCHKKGDIIDLFSHQRGIPSKQALSLLAKDLGIKSSSKRTQTNHQINKELAKQEKDREKHLFARLVNLEQFLLSEKKRFSDKPPATEDDWDYYSFILHDLDYITYLADLSLESNTTNEIEKVVTRWKHHLRNRQTKKRTM